MLKHSDKGWDNGTLVYLKATNKVRLLNVLFGMTCNGIENAPFFEPDIGNEITAVACLGKNKIVKKLPLLT
jgi:hypothetical protein